MGPGTPFNWAQRKCCFHLASKTTSTCVSNTNFQNRELGNPFIKTVCFFLESIFLNVGFTSEDLLRLITQCNSHTITDILTDIEQIFGRLLNLLTECNLYPKLQ